MRRTTHISMPRVGIGAILPQDSYIIKLATFLQYLVFILDILAYPFYFMWQQPWRYRKYSDRLKAKRIQISPNSITWKSLDTPHKCHKEMVRENIDTMANLMSYCEEIYSMRNCLGTREILIKEEDQQQNGKTFTQYIMGDYIWKTYAQVDMHARNFGRGIRELDGLPKQNVAIFAETRAEWMIAAHGLFKQSIPIVTIYSILSEEGITHVLNEAEIKLLITSQELLKKVKGLIQYTPLLQTVVYMEDMVGEVDIAGLDNGRLAIIKFSDVLRVGSISLIDECLPSPSDIAIIMYTSGSTGVPKGVILTHSNLISSLKCFDDCNCLSPLRSKDRLLGLLPLAHVFELLSESFCMVKGMSIGYSSSLTLTDQSSKIKSGTQGDAPVLKANIMIAVPLILDRFCKAVEERVRRESWFSQVMFKFGYEYKRYWTAKKFSTPLINRFIFNEVRNVMGGRLQLIITGGAPLTPATHEFIQICLCARVIQGYGLTETSSCATIMDAYDGTFGNVGYVMSACNIRLEDWDEGNYHVTDTPYPRGEILVGGDNVSSGYYKLSDSTQEAFVCEDDKWWHRTGDIGQMRDDGTLTIIDRKKDLVKLQNGEYISLGKIEAELKTSPYVDNICVFGFPSKEYCVAIVVPNPLKIHELAEFSGIKGKDFEDMCDMVEIQKAMLEELTIHAKKRKLNKLEVPLKLALCKEIWLPDNGLVTAAFKLKRKELEKRYWCVVQHLYND